LVDRSGGDLLSAPHGDPAFALAGLHMLVLASALTSFCHAARWHLDTSFRRGLPGKDLPRSPLQQNVSSSHRAHTACWPRTAIHADALAYEGVGRLSVARTLILDPVVYAPCEGLVLRHTALASIIHSGESFDSSGGVFGTDR